MRFAYQPKQRLPYAKGVAATRCLPHAPGTCTRTGVNNYRQQIDDDDHDNNNNNDNDNDTFNTGNSDNHDIGSLQPFVATIPIAAFAHFDVRLNSNPDPALLEDLPKTRTVAPPPEEEQDHSKTPI
jgi:hypothetical protein